MGCFVDRASCRQDLACHSPHIRRHRRPTNAQPGLVANGMKWHGARIGGACRAALWLSQAEPGGCGEGSERPEPSSNAELYGGVDRRVR